MFIYKDNNDNDIKYNINQWKKSLRNDQVKKKS